MGQVTFRCPKHEEWFENFPNQECWGWVECNDGGHRLFKEFIVNEVKIGHIYHMMKPISKKSEFSDTSDCSPADDEESCPSL